MSTEPSSLENGKSSPLSLNRLREAFAAMLEPAGHAARADGQEPKGPVPAASAESKPCEVNPRSVVEAILFVGLPDNRSHTARELAAAMRGVSPGEIDDAVRELNSNYDADETPYHIEGTNIGYRLVLRSEYARIRDKFFGRVREAKLSTAAMEVLSVIAYNQPITAEEVNQLRGSANGAALATLVRRRLARMKLPDGGGSPCYTTTERFLKLFGLESLEALPRSEELENA